MKTGMKFAVLGLGLAVTVAGATVPLGAAEAAPPARVMFAVDEAGAPPTLEQVQYFYGGRHYCWYEGWYGPGWYWCGYGSRRGYGWGGGYGWHGWRGGHGGGWHGGHGGWHGGHGGHGDHGGHGGHGGEHHR